MTDETSSRLTELETRNAYQEATIADLSAHTYAQQQRLERLERLLEGLAEKVKGLASGDAVPLPDNERPPHY